MNKLGCIQNDKRNELILVSYELFAKKGLERTSVRDIANIADVNVNTVYYYFKTKAEIVICCVEYGLRTIYESLLTCFESKEKKLNADELLNKAVESKEQFCWCYQVIASPNYNWIVKDIVSNIRNECVDKISDFFKKQRNWKEIGELVRNAIFIITDYVITEDINCRKSFNSVINQINNLIK